jgi:hypothetical protein
VSSVVWTLRVACTYGVQGTLRSIRKSRRLCDSQQGLWKESNPWVPQMVAGSALEGKTVMQVPTKWLAVLTAAV